MKAQSPQIFLPILAAVVIYFMSPVFAAKMITSIPGARSPVIGTIFSVFYAPAIALNNHFPPYKWILDKQAAWMGI